MKSTRAHPRLRFTGTLFALVLVAMTSQVGGASAARGSAGEPPAARSAAIVPLPGGRELLAWFMSVSRGSPAPGSWALFLAGLAGVCAIGHRRVSAIGDRTLRAYRLRR